MKLNELLGANLMNDVLCDLFETYDVDVVFTYDRTHENIKDSYNAEIVDLGLEFIFDENRNLETLFIKPVNITTFYPFDFSELPRFKSKSEAMIFSNNNSIKITEGKTDFREKSSDWIRLDYESYSIHYEYVCSELYMITIMSGNS